MPRTAHSTIWHFHLARTQRMHRLVGLEITDIFRQHGKAYRLTHGATLLPEQRRVMRAIEACRTAVLGGHVDECDSCGHRRLSYNSCRNRHCPKCQSLASAWWLAERTADDTTLKEACTGHDWS